MKQAHKKCRLCSFVEEAASFFGDSYANDIAANKQRLNRTAFSARFRAQAGAGHFRIPKKRIAYTAIQLIVDTPGVFAKDYNPLSAFLGGGRSADSRQWRMYCPR